MTSFFLTTEYNWVSPNWHTGVAVFVKIRFSSARSLQKRWSRGGNREVPPPLRVPADPRPAFRGLPEDAPRRRRLRGDPGLQRGYLPGREMHIGARLAFVGRTLVSAKTQF